MRVEYLDMKASEGIGAVPVDTGSAASVGSHVDALASKGNRPAISTIGSSGMLIQNCR